MQHQITRVMPLLTRLSTIRTFPHAAVHTKEATLFEACAHQIHFQGNVSLPLCLL